MPMMLVRAGLFALASAFASAAAATCIGDPILTCTIGSKTLSLCLGDETATYSFGPAGSPELILSRPIREVDYIAWSGFGRYPTNKVVFSNHDYSYVITSGYDRHEDGDRPYEVATFDGGNHDPFSVLVNVISFGLPVVEDYDKLERGVFRHCSKMTRFSAEEDCPRQSCFNEGIR
jgi:hypothetical protein